jgi:hypothetical protein
LTRRITGKSNSREKKKLLKEKKGTEKKEAVKEKGNSKGNRGKRRGT